MSRLSRTAVDLALTAHGIDLRAPLPVSDARDLVREAYRRGLADGRPADLTAGSAADEVDRLGQVLHTASTSPLSACGPRLRWEHLAERHRQQYRAGVVALLVDLNAHGRLSRR